MDLLDLAEDLQNRLLDAGFLVHRYDAFSTNSIYLKLEYGVSNSIRISDHRGKTYLHYRYIIGTNISKYKIDKSGKYPRYYYPCNLINKLMKAILEDRDQKIKKYGIWKYRYWMEEKRQASIREPGFWRDAKLVTRRKYNDKEII